MESFLRKKIGYGIVSLVFLAGPAFGQELKIKNASVWELQGRVQLQHVYNPDIAGDAEKTNNGFRIRRGRLQISTQLTDFVETKFQIEARDNSPRLKDAEGMLKFANGFYLRFGQFKVPVWREELRSSSKLLLIERSVVAEFLGEYNLSVRHIGVEFGRAAASGVEFAVNLSNGAGEGGREDAGRTKSDFVNNGKLLTGRVNVPVGKVLQLGVSAALNNVGNQIGAADDRGTIRAVAPDFGLYLDAGERGKLEIEGGLVAGAAGKVFLQTAEDENFTLFDVTGRYTHKLSHAAGGFAGMDAIELAAGISHIDFGVDDVKAVRFGPAFYFGKQTRLQVNGEIETPTDGDSTFQLRSQMTFNF